MTHRLTMPLLAFLLLILTGAAVADPYFEDLQPEEKVSGFTALNVYENASEEAMGARFISDEYGFIIDLMRIQSVPQAFWWIKTVPTSSKGEPHACEHLLLGKGNRGRYVAVLEDMALSSSSAFTSQLRTCYHFNTIAGIETFYDLFEAKLMAFLHPDFTDEEIRREVCHLGVTEDPETGLLKIEEKGTVYTEMVSAYEKHWYHTWGALNELVYGKEHPLSYNSGGNPNVMRSMTPEDMWEFIEETHHLANMGVVVAIPDEVDVDNFMVRMDAILGRCQDFADHSDHIGIDAYDLPPAQPAPEGTLKMVTYPSERIEDQGYMLYSWPADVELSLQDEMMLDLFVGAFAGGPTTNLYDLFINSETRSIDIGGRSVYAGYDDDLEVAIYCGLVGVNRDEVTRVMVDSVARMIQSELQRVHDFEDGSPELMEFNEKVRANLAQTRRQFDDYLNSPPMFGFRSGVGSGWLSLLATLEKETGFRKSLTLGDRLDAADSLLATDKNIWAGLIERCNVLNRKPYMVGAVPEPEMIAEAASAKEKRLAEYVEGFKKQYATEDAQAAIEAYQKEFDARTVQLEEVRAKQELPEFVDNPPMTLDPNLDYEVMTLPGEIPMVASTFENMKSSTVALALRLDVIPESLLVYSPFLASALTRIGVVIDGEPVPYDQMDVRLRNEVMGLYAYFDHGYQTRRAELILTGEASRTEELPAVLDWMNHTLYSPYLSVDNLPRIQDVIDQSLSDARNRMKRSEEAWVNNPAAAYRFQTDPLMMSTLSFLTQTHLFQRLRCRLTDPGDSTSREEIAMLFDVLGEFGADMDRDKLTSILTNLEQSDKDVPDSLRETLPPPAQTLSETAKEIVARVARELKATLADIPDANLSEDWVYLCAQTKQDLLVEPEQALEDIECVLHLVRNAGNARMYMVSNSADRKAIMPEIHELVGRLDAHTQPLRQDYAKDERIDHMLRSRQPEVFDPVYVGLVHEGTRNGVMVFGCQHARPYDTTEQAVIDCLAGKLFGGGGPHGIFMSTWAAGLAYSNGYGYSQSTGRMSYYAERCPDVAQTMKFVVDLLKNASDDSSLVNYAVAQIFNASRAPSRYEDRAKAMAADLTDGRTPERVRAFRQRVLDLARSDRDVYSILDDRMEEAYGPVLIGYGPKLSQSEDGVFFLIGPEPQFESLEQYIETAEGSAQPVYRLYPRDFWLRAPVDMKS